MEKERRVFMLNHYYAEISGMTPIEVIGIRESLMQEANENSNVGEIHEFRFEVIGDYLVLTVVYRK